MATKEVIQPEDRDQQLWAEGSGAPVTPCSGADQGSPRLLALAGAPTSETRHHLESGQIPFNALLIQKWQVKREGSGLLCGLPQASPSRRPQPSLGLREEKRCPVSPTHWAKGANVWVFHFKSFLEPAVSWP